MPSAAIGLLGRFPLPRDRIRRDDGAIEADPRPAAPEALLVLLELRAPEENRQPLLDVLAEMLPSTRAADGCRGITAHQAQDSDEGTVVLVEEWASAEHYERYVAWRQARGDLKTLLAATEGRPTVRLLRPMDL